MKEGVSVHKLTLRTGSDRTSIQKWFLKDGLRPVRIEVRKRGEPCLFYDEKEALECIKTHQADVIQKGGSIDPETGLTWSQANLMEKTLALRMERVRQQKIDSLDLMPTSDHHAIIAALVEKFSQIPATMKSRFGLNDEQTNGLVFLMDDARNIIVKELTGKTD